MLELSSRVRYQVHTCAAVGQYQGPYESTPSTTQPGASTAETGNPTPANPEERQPQQSLQRRTLLNERLAGDFSRTFTFPTSIVEDATKASVENGLLCLVVPKRDQTKKKGRRIPILGGSWGIGGGQKVA